MKQNYIFIFVNNAHFIVGPFQDNLEAVRWIIANTKIDEENKSSNNDEYHWHIVYTADPTYTTVFVPTEMPINEMANSVKNV